MATSGLPLEFIGTHARIPAPCNKGGSVKFEVGTGRFVAEHRLLGEMAQVGCYTADSSREVARTVTQLGSLLRSRGNLTVGSSPGSGTSSFACLQLEGGRI